MYIPHPDASSIAPEIQTQFIDDCLNLKSAAALIDRIKAGSIGREQAVQLRAIKEWIYNDEIGKIWMRNFTKLINNYQNLMRDEIDTRHRGTLAGLFIFDIKRAINDAFDYAR